MDWSQEKIRSCSLISVASHSVDHGLAAWDGRVEFWPWDFRTPHFGTWLWNICTQRAIPSSVDIWCPQAIPWFSKGFLPRIFHNLWDHRKGVFNMNGGWDYTEQNLWKGPGTFGTQLEKPWKAKLIFQKKQMDNIYDHFIWYILYIIYIIYIYNIYITIYLYVRLEML
jgi:hypothetical protein